MSNRAWVTLATNDSYGLGALVLAHSLRRVSSAYPAVVLITPSVTDPMRDRLRAVFAEVIIVDVLDSGDAAHLALLQRPELGITFTKIHCWNLTQYEKCVFLDADTLIVQNCDELFEREQLSAAPDVGWPDCFNSGVFVYTPSADTFSQLIAFAQERGSFDGGDQGLLNSFFSDWARGDINKHLPFLYNVTSAAFYSYLPALKHFGQDLKIIHFIGAAKPWLQQFNFESGTVDAPEHIRGFLQLWWDLFVSQVHCQLDTGMVEVEESPEVPAITPQDVSQEYYYQPILDPESEFSWHHPHVQNREEPHEKQIDVTEFFDPWDIYKGHIPAKTGNNTNPNSELTRIDKQEEVRNYAWNYQAQEHNQPHNRQTQHSNFIWEQQHRTQIHQTNHHWQDSSQQHDNPSQPTDHHYRQYSTQHDNQTYNSDSNWPRHSQQYMQQQNNQTDRHWQHDSKQTHNTENNWQYFPSNNTETLQCATEPQYIQQHNNHTHNYDHISQNNQQQKDLVHHTNEPWTNYHQQHENQSFKTNSNWQPNVQQNHNQTYNQWQQQQGNQNSNNDCVWQFDPQHHNNQTNGSHNLEYISQQRHNGHCDDNENYHSHDHHTHLQNHRGEHQNNTSSPTCQFNTNDLINNLHHCEEPEHIHKKHTNNENITVHHVQVENAKKRNRHKRKLHPIDDPNVLRLNGDVSDNESNCSEEVIPRHPYDGFFLRHRVTIDSRGRKICSHEIPPTPPVSPPPESLENGFSDNDEDEYLSTNNFEAQSGVAGNLARVLPGATGQREALDELTRRQGWEAGNIDYMGADSFDNIWAKISQTLSKPRISPPKQQSPPKEVTPAQPASEQIEVQCGEATKEPISEQVEVAKEATPVASAAPIEIIASVESAVVLATEAKSVPAPPQVISAIEPSIQSTIPAEPANPVDTPAVAKIVAQIETAPIEVSASSEATDAAKGVAPVETVICPAKTEIPVEAVPPTEISAVPETVEAVTTVETTPAEISATSATPAAVELVSPVAAAPIKVPEAIKAPAAPDAVAPANAKTIEIPANIKVPASVEAVAPTAPVETAVPVEIPVALETVAPAGKVDIPTAPAVSPPSSIPVTLESTELEVSTIVKESASEKPVASENVKKLDDQVPTAEPVKIIEQPEQKTEITAEKKGKSVPLIPSKPTAEKPSEITAKPQSTDKSPVAAAALETTPEKPILEADTDSPPLVNTPSKEEELDVSAVKSEERRKPAGKLKLVPPAAADPLPTPDSELEDAATLAQSIIASELRTPTVTSPESAVSPASPPLAPTLTQSLAVEKTEVPTPPVGTVSLAQIGVNSMPKGKSTTAAQIESSVETPLSEATSDAPTPSPTVESTPIQAPEAAASTPTSVPVAETPTPLAAPSEAPKKKIVKKVVKKEAGTTGADAPVPPPRKKEKKPKEK